MRWSVCAEKSLLTPLEVGLCSLVSCTFGCVRRCPESRWSRGSAKTNDQWLEKWPGRGGFESCCSTMHTANCHCVVLRCCCKFVGGYLTCIYKPPTVCYLTDLVNGKLNKGTTWEVNGVIVCVLKRDICPESAVQVDILGQSHARTRENQFRTGEINLRDLWD